MIDHAAQYWKWAHAFTYTPSLHVLLLACPRLSIVHRKALLGICRSQGPLIDGSLLQDSISDCANDIILLPATTAFVRIELVDWIPYRFVTALRDFQDAYIDPSAASILAHAVRVAPFINEDGLSEMVRSALSKELEAALNIYEVSRFDYRCIFDQQVSSRKIPFCSRLQPEEEIASSVFLDFESTVSQLNNRLIFPDLGTKTVGATVARNFWEMYRTAGCSFMDEGDATTSSPDSVTPTDCMRLFIETGCEVPGPVEMRSTWKFNQISPRVYYARGGSVMSASMFIQPVMNIIIDHFAEVHRLNRFQPIPTDLTEDDLVALYDYSSFTSWLYEIIRFIAAMSEFYRNRVSLRCVHPVHGVVMTDLGDLLKRYLDECTMFAEFEISSGLDPFDSPIAFRHTNGMLGIPGNIFIATLFHGIYVRFLAGQNRSRCVGDDAVMYYRGDVLDTNEVDLMVWRVQAPCPANFEKFRVLKASVEPDLQRYRYVKRPITRNRNEIETGHIFNVASIAVLYSFQDRWHFNPPSSSHECRVSFKSLCRMITDMKNLSFEFSNEDGNNPLWRHAMWMLLEIRRMDPTGEHAPIQRVDPDLRYSLPHSSRWGTVTYEEYVLVILFRFLSLGIGRGVGEEGTPFL
jgi:hypothetical protein